MTEALRALAVFAEPPSPEHAAIAAALALPAAPTAAEHTGVLGLQVLPYASIYLGAEGMLGGEARDRIAGFWRALGGSPPHEPDHASVLLAALAELAGSDVRRPDTRVHAARTALYWEHIASWTPPFLAALRRIGPPFYAAWADALDAMLAAEADALGPPTALPLHLRAAPALPDPPPDLDSLLAAVLAPVRAGIVIARDDLARCADDLGLGLRAGERRFALRSLLAQDTGGVLRWLAGEAARQATAYGDATPVTRWWQARAEAGGRWLEQLAEASVERR
jgi:hypothetical protein